MSHYFVRLSSFLLFLLFAACRGLVGLLITTQLASSSGCFEVRSVTFSLCAYLWVKIGQKYLENLCH